MKTKIRKLCAFAALAAMCAGAAQAVDWNSGRILVDADYEGISNIGANGDTVVFQTNHTVTIKGGPYIGATDTAVAWLLDGGTLQLKGTPIPRGRYIHIRQTGGGFFMEKAFDYNVITDETMSADFVYSGCAHATNQFDHYRGPVNIAVMDEAYVYADSLARTVSEAYIAAHPRNVIVNGGYLAMYSGNGIWTNTYYSFNGGTLEALNYTYGLFGVSGLGPWVRVYEKGGCVIKPSDLNVDLPDIREPEGNVVWSVELSDEARSMEFDVPPAVVISDSTGSGSNAVAVVDYDYVSKSVTNITILCRGENYSDSAGAVTANFRYGKTDDVLLTTPLVCGVGACEGGDFTFATKNDNINKGFKMGNTTNTYHGATIIDMDRSGLYDGNSYAGEYGAGVMVYSSTFFPNCTNITIKSGQLYYANGRSGFENLFPNVSRLEVYRGHLAYTTATFADVVVGGRFWLCAHNMAVPSYVTVTRSLTIDYGAAVAQGTAPAVLPSSTGAGNFNINSGVSISIKDWSALPRGAKTAVLDLSGVDGTVPALPDIAESEEGVMWWDAGERIFYARRHADGLFLIFR